MKKIKLLLILLVFLCSIATVSAEDTNNTDTAQLIEDTSSNQEANIILQTDDEINENNNVLQSSGNDVLTANPKSISELRYLVQNTPEGGTLVLNDDYECYSSIRSGASEITITKSITIDGQGHYLDAAHCGRIFNIKADGVTLKNINFKQGLIDSGNDGILVLCKGSNINIIDCSFKDCTYVHAKSDGSDFEAGLGALAILGDYSKVINCVFDDNTGYVAHIYINGDNNEINNCKIASIPGTRTWTHDYEAGGSHWEDLYADYSIKVDGKNNVITDCTFSSSRVSESTVQLNDEGNTVKNCEFHDITAPESTIYINSGKNTVESCNFNQINRLDIPKYKNGGTIYINSNDNTVTGCYFEDCIGIEGGAVYINKKNNKVINCIFVNNIAVEDGGAIYCDAVNEIKYNVFINNQAKRGKDIYSSSKISANDNYWGNVVTDKNTNYASVNDKVTVSSWYYAKLMSIYEVHAPIGEKIPVKLVITSDEKADTAPDKYFSLPVRYPVIFDVHSDSQLNSSKIGLTTNTNTVYLTVANKTTTTVETKVYNKDISLTIETIEKYFFTFLNNLIQSSGANIDLSNDYEYFEDYDSALENGILIGVDPDEEYNSITIDGHGHTIDGMDMSRIFIIDNNCQVTLKNINFANVPGYAIWARYDLLPRYLTVENCTFTNINGGPAIYSQRYTKIVDTTFTKCTSKTNGGAISVDGKTMFTYCTIDNATFINCSSDEYGGAVYVNLGSLDIANSKFIKTKAKDGGAVYDVLKTYDAGDKASIINSTFQDIDNSKGGAINTNVKQLLIDNCTFTNINGGSAIYSQNNTKVTGSHFTNCVSKANGGAIYQKSGTLNIADSQLTNCKADDNGGAIYLNTGTMTINSSNFTNNNAIKGGAIELKSGKLSISNSRLTKNKASNNGGAIYMDSNTLNVKDCEFANNEASNNGGTIYLDTGSMHISRSEFKENKAKNGGTLYIKDASLDITGSKFTSNEAKNDGGAIYDNLDDNKAQKQKTSIKDSTFLKNTAGSNGGAVNVNVGKLTVDNCTFKSNIAKSGGGIWSNKHSRTIKNSEFIKNKALKEAGAIYRGTVEKLELINDTFVDNTPHKFDTVTASFTDLQKLINNAHGTLLLEQMIYKFNPKTDKNLEFGILINKPIEIVGENSTIDGSYAARLFRVESSDVTIKNLNLINGKIDGKGAAIYWNGANGKLENCLLKGNLGKIGGAVFVGKTKLTINSCKFIKNYATYRGGAVYVGNKNTKITNNLFKDNQAASGYNKAIYWIDRKWINLYKNNTFINNTQFDKGGNAEDYKFINNTQFDKGGNAEDYNGYSQTTQQYNSGESSTYRTIDKITANNRQISIQDNKLTLDVLNQIFNKDFRNGHLLVYIDDILVFNATTTDNLLQVIFDLLSLLSGDHEIKVVFTNNAGNISTYTENITI